jgi:hypothetical protein
MTSDLGIRPLLTARGAQAGEANGSSAFFLALMYRTVPYLKGLVAGFSPRRPRFYPRSGHVGFVLEKVALEQVFSEYFGFLCQFSFHQLLHIH